MVGGGVQNLAHPSYLTLPPMHTPPTGQVAHARHAGQAVQRGRPDGRAAASLQVQAAQAGELAQQVVHSVAAGSLKKAGEGRGDQKFRICMLGPAPVPPPGSPPPTHTCTSTSSSTSSPPCKACNASSDEPPFSSKQRLVGRGWEWG